MTSKNLFFKLIKENLKRRLWVIALAVLAMAIFLPIRCALVIESYGYVGEKDWARIQAVYIVQPSSFYLLFLTIAGAVVCALSGFYYLHSRKKVDLYHSIPVRRETLFAVSYTNGILIYVIPLFVNILLCFLIMALHHVMSPAVLEAAFRTFGIHLLYYCLIYTITILAVMMTGNFIVSILGTGVFLFYGPMLIEIWILYCSNFFKTYYTKNDGFSDFVLLSPLLTFFKVVEEDAGSQEFRTLILVSVIALIILIGLVVFLYKKRPSEAAGKSMAFAVTQPVIKVLLVIPVALGGGIVLRNAVAANYDGWFLFGLIFTLILTSALIQVIYNFDIRSMFKQKKQLLAYAVIAGGIACFFRFDLLHYNTYIPDLSNIKSMSIYVSGIDSQLQAYDPETHRYLSNDSYNLKNMQLAEVKPAYELAKIGIQSINQSGTETNFSYGKEGYYNYTVKYTLKNDHKVYRQYCIAIDQGKKLLMNIYSDSGYKKTHFPINQWSAKDIDQITVSYASDILNYTSSGAYGNGNITIDAKTDQKKIAHFMEVYLEELNNMTLEEASEMPLAQAAFSTDQTSMIHYYIYPSFTKTLALLKELGFDVSKQIDINNISRIIINKYHQDENGNNYTASEQGNSMIYMDTKQIAQLYPLLVNCDVYQYNTSLFSVESNMDVLVEYKTKDGEINSFSYYFLTGSVPDFVNTDLNKKNK